MGRVGEGHRTAMEDEEETGGQRGPKPLGITAECVEKG